MTDNRQINTRWGNDSAVGLTRAIRRGAVLATTNPVMVNSVRKEEPETWDKVKTDLWRRHPDFAPEQIASYMTMEVVRRNCRELRPIFNATDGKYGYVCLQISPKNATDAEKMAEEVELLHEELTEKLQGIPNTAFKVPGTKAGLEAAGRLTSQGIPVTITASASFAQHSAFAEVIERGNAKVSFLVLMNGRLDDPVKDELSKLGLPDAEEISRWASTAVIRKSYDILFKKKKYKKSTLLAASLRGPWNVEGSITDGESQIIITAFPDKAKIYDSEERSIASHIEEKIPDEVMEKLLRSTVFRQAYDIDKMAPDDFDSFYPVSATLDQFKKNYEEFLEYIKR
jgi:transaldolase